MPLLTDDGGHPCMHTIPRLDEGLRRIGLVKDKAEPLSDWSRDEWGAELQGDEVKIYSLHDEDYAEFWKLADFEKILPAWRDFLQTGPTMRGSVTFSVVSSRFPPFAAKSCLPSHRIQQRWFI